MPEEKSGYKQKRLRDKIKDKADSVVSVIPGVGYELKRPAIFDLYEGEIENMNWDYLEALDPFRVVWQATVGAHGRHLNDKIDYGVTEFVRQMKDRGMKYGLYHLMLPHAPQLGYNGTPQRQADFYCRAVDALGGPGHMMPILDTEISWFSGRQWADQNFTWLDIVDRRYGEPTLIYTSKYYWSFLNYKQGKPVQLLPPPWTAGHPGWFAGYLWVPYLDGHKAMPKTYQAWGFKDWAVWQYYDKGRSNPPRGFPKFPIFPASDLNLVSPWFEAYLTGRWG